VKVVGYSKSTQYFYKKTIVITDNELLLSDLKEELSEHTVLLIYNNIVDGYLKINDGNFDFCIVAFSFEKEGEIFSKNKVLRDFSEKNKKLINISKAATIDKQSFITNYQEYIAKNQKENFGILLAKMAFKRNIPYIIVPTDIWDVRLIKGFVNLLVLKKYIAAYQQGITNFYLPKNLNVWKDVYYSISENYETIKEKNGFRIFDFLD